MDTGSALLSSFGSVQGAFTPKITETSMIIEVNIVSLFDEENIKRRASPRLGSFAPVIDGILGNFSKTNVFLPYTLMKDYRVNGLGRSAASKY